MRTPRIAALVAVAALVLTGCTPDATAQQYLEGTDKGYITSDTRWKEWAPAERVEATPFEGVLDTGDAVSSDDLVGKVSVVNFWYTNCGPCRVEAPDLQAVWEEYEDDGDVAFLGVNLEDSAPSAQAFADEYGITYPSVIDEGDGAAKFAFAQLVPLTAVPVTLVLDREGRAAARILGIVDRSVLSTLVRDTLAETP